MTVEDEDERELGPAVEKVIVFFRDHGAHESRLVAEITVFPKAVVAEFKDEGFASSVEDGIHDDGLGGVILMEHGALFLRALERRFHRSSTTWVVRVPLS